MQNAHICKDSINANRLQTPFATLAGIIEVQLKAKRDNIPQQELNKLVSLLIDHL